MEKVYRDSLNKKIAGVCGGLGAYFKVDPTILRLFFFVMTLFSFGSLMPLVIIAYLFAWMIIPVSPTPFTDYECRRLYRSVKNRRIMGVCGGLSETLGVRAFIIRLLVMILPLLIVGGLIFVAYASGMPSCLFIYIILFVLLLVCSLPFIILYAGASFIIPVDCKPSCGSCNNNS